jgi:serine-type D-Ala-D-Ala carboxypeptidase/endopeptidase
MTTTPHRDLDEIIRPLLSTAPGATGMAVAAQRGEKQTFLVTGATDRDSARPITPATRFELGSTTKTFTALLLAEMVHRGEVRYDDPVDRYLPRGWCLRRPAPVTLEHLATHTSGLPRVPLGVVLSGLPTWYSNPYQRYGQRQLATTLSRVRLRSPPGTRYRYSNIGFGLLGWLLAHAADRPFEDLLTERVLHPLGLTDTGSAPDPQATGHWHGRPRPTFRLPGLPAAGALRSTTRDMLRYLTAHFTADAARQPSLAHALCDVTRPRVSLPGSDEHLGLAWFLLPGPDHDLLFHPGATRGFTAFAGFSPQTRTALVALVNTTSTARSAFIHRAHEVLQALASGTGPDRILPTSLK